MSGELTPNFVVDRDDIEVLTADWTTVGLVAPLEQTSVVQHVAATRDLRDMVVVDSGRYVLFVGSGERFWVLNGEAFVEVLEFL